MSNHVQSAKHVMVVQVSWPSSAALSSCSPLPPPWWSASSPSWPPPWPTCLAALSRTGHSPLLPPLLPPLSTPCLPFDCHMLHCQNIQDSAQACPVFQSQNYVLKKESTAQTCPVCHAQHCPQKKGSAHAWPICRVQHYQTQLRALPTFALSRLPIAWQKA